MVSINTLTRDFSANVRTVVSDCFNTFRLCPWECYLESRARVKESAGLKIQFGIPYSVQQEYITDTEITKVPGRVSIRSLHSVENII